MYVNILTYICGILFMQINKYQVSTWVCFYFNFLILSSSWGPVLRALKYLLIVRNDILHF